ncbi:ABC transporter permease [Brachybacterium tyrofermentans]|uniref:ABC transporter permease n=1 Tax=Brachybacterium tyrofermentans TaxID=47848 RepID=UPI003FD1FB0A
MRGYLRGGDAWAAWAFEARKLARASVARTAVVAVILLTAVTTIGGYAAAVHAPDTDMGHQAATMVTAPGWAGYTGLAVTSVGITMLLASGIVMAWVAGREFVDGTIVGLFAIPLSRSAIARAKITSTLAGVVLLSVVTALVTAIGGIALGLPFEGAAGSAATVAGTAILLGAGALPAMWAATYWRGYLAGIAVALALVVVTNVAAGFGLGAYLPWAIPVLWASPGSTLSPVLLGAPIAVALLSSVAIVRAWRALQLGVS